MKNFVSWGYFFFSDVTLDVFSGLSRWLLKFLICHPHRPNFDVNQLRLFLKAALLRNASKLAFNDIYFGEFCGASASVRIIGVAGLQSRNN